MFSVATRIAIRSYRLSMTLAFVITFLLTTEMPANSQDAPHLDIDSFRLPNGLKVALNHDPLAPRTTVCVAYHVGSKNERPGLTGFAHFFEHMMFRGTINVPNFDIPLQPAGGSPNAFTSNDMTVYFETVSNNYVERALFMEAERMAFLSSGLSLDKFDTEREIVKNERRQRMENVPYGLASETINASLFPAGHPYSWSVIGSMKDLNNADLGDLRDFFYEFYHPGNATLTVVGSFDPDSTREWIEEYFGILQTGPEIATVSIPDEKVEARRLEQSDQVRFPRVYWTWRTVPDSHADSVALQVLSGILSSGEASRLYRDLVVDQQVASDVNAAVDSMELDGSFSVDATVAPDATVERVEARLEMTLQRLAETGPSEEELRRVLVSQQTDTISALTSTMQRAIVISMGLSQYDDAHYYQQQFKLLSEVTADDVKRVAEQYLVDEKHVLVIRPVGEAESESEAILAGPLEGDRRTPAPVAQRTLETDTWLRLPGPIETSAYQPPEFETVELSNGLEVWFANWQTLPLTSVQLVLPVGHAHDPPGMTGLSNLVARSWDKGSAELGPAELTAALELHGTSVSVAQSHDTTSLVFSLTTAELPGAMELVASMVREPRFDENAVDLERSLMLSDLASGPSSPAWIGSRVFERLVFGHDHPLGLPGVGFEASVSNLSREDVERHYRRNFSPRQAKLIIVGSSNRDETIQLLERTWGKWINDETAERRPTPIMQQATDRVYAVDKPGAVQSIIMIGRPWRARDDSDKVAQDVGDRIFAGDFLSRVNQNLRERNGYTYGVRSSFGYFEGGSRWRMSTSIRADATGAGLREIMNEIESVRGDRPISEEEVNVASDAAMNVFPERFATPDSIAASLVELARYDLADDTYANYASQLANVTANDAAQIIAQLTDPSQLTVLVVGDRETVEPQLAEQGFDEVVWLDTNGDPK